MVYDSLDTLLCEALPSADDNRVAEAVRVLDPRRLEIRQEVFCPASSTTLRYRVETWFFLPTSLQVNRWTYPPQQLQQSLKNYIRLGVPACEMANLLAERVALLQTADTCLDLILAGVATSDDIARYEECLKHYVLLCRSSLARFRERLRAEAESDLREAMAKEFVRDYIRCLRRYRRLSKKAERARALLNIPPFLFCDEYVSVLGSEGLGQCLRLLRDGAERRRLQVYVDAQLAYRRKLYPGSIPEPESDNEGPAFRWSILKKYVDMPLFLEIRRREGTSMVAHGVSGLAAAVAMIFATAVAYVWQMEYGALSGPLFAAMVVGYIFKDRMKDVARARLFSMFQRWIPDRKHDLYDGRGTSVGTCDESFRFDYWERMPEDVREVRNRTHFVEILNSFHSEDILHYSKDVDIRHLPRVFTGNQHSILDITRMDISDFLRHAAEVLASPQRMEERLVPGEKTYHMDMVRRITCNKATALERFRIVITSAGIKRIDEIQTLRHY